MFCNNPKLDHVNINAHTKYEYPIKDIERKRKNYDGRTDRWTNRRAEGQTIQILYSPPFQSGAIMSKKWCSDFFTNLFLWVPGLTRPKFFASQTRSSASHMGPTLNHKFYVSIQIRPIHRSQFEKQDTVILTYTIKSKLTLSCKIIFRAQAISLCSSNSACLQVYCWKLLSPWTYGDDTILIFVNTICSQYSPRTSWACSNTLTILFAELILGFV